MPNDTIQFGYVVYFQMYNKDSKPLAAFPDLKKAKEYVSYKYVDIMANGFFYIDAPEGRYIYGYDSKEENKWFEPHNITEAFVYDLKLDDVVPLPIEYMVTKRE